MRVLLVNSNLERTPIPLAPIGLCCIASAAEKAGHDVRVLDPCFSRHVQQDVVRAIREHAPEVIGISIRNVDNADYANSKSYLEDIKAIVDWCRGTSDAPIVLGGSGFSVMPQPLLEYLNCDWGIVGDGEVPFVELCQRLEAGKPLKDVPSLVYRQDSAVRFNHAPFDFDITALPFPNIPRWVDFSLYDRYDGSMPIQTKRGCVFKCVYCTYTVVEGTRRRLKPPEMVVDEIEDLQARVHPRSFEFVDSVFNSPPAHAIAICEEILRRNLKVTLQTMGINPGLTSVELFDVMKRAGFKALICTPESASEKVLDHLQKGFGPERIVKTAEALKKVGIPTMWVFLFGGPGETEETVRETLDFIERYISPRDTVFMTLGIRIYPNTPMEVIAQREGYIAEKDDLLRPVFYFAPTISRAALYEMIARAAASHPNYLFISDIQIPWIPALTRLMTLLHFPIPLWKHVSLVNRTLKGVGYQRRIMRGGVA